LAGAWGIRSPLKICFDFDVDVDFDVDFDIDFDIDFKDFDF
jgi:hypothetical protein